MATLTFTPKRVSLNYPYQATVHFDWKDFRAAKESERVFALIEQGAPGQPDVLIERVWPIPKRMLTSTGDIVILRNLFREKIGPLQ